MADTVRGRVLWYELLTTDMKAAEAFYGPLVGWSVMPFDGAPDPYDMFARPGNIPVAGVMNIPAGMNFPPHWGMYVGVDDLGQAIARVKQLGGSELGPLVDIPTVGKMQTMMDPQHAAFSLYQPAAPPGPESEPAVGDGSWHELMTTDAEAALRFYTELFGWTPTEAMDMGPMGKYHMFGRNFPAPGVPIGGMMNKSAEMQDVPPNWGVYFRVPDINRAAELVKSHGGHVLNGPMEVPGGDMIINARDPQGAHFSLHAKPAA